MNIKNTTLVFAIALAVFAGVTVVVQVATVDESTTKLESALFNALQFVLSIGFAWILARMSFKEEFREGQKQFAISAYRRINEINSGVKRLLSRVRRQSPALSKETRQELEVIQAISTGVSDSIQSSIADWADIIGEELVTLDRIEELQHEDVFSSEIVQQDVAEAVALDNRIEEMNRLIQSLPHQLQVIARSERRDDLISAIRQLDREKERIGTVLLSGFWDPSFERDVRELSEGDILTAQIGDAGSRIGALIAYDADGRSGS